MRFLIYYPALECYLLRVGKDEMSQVSATLTTDISKARSFPTEAAAQGIVNRWDGAGVGLDASSVEIQVTRSKEVKR